VAVSEYGSLSSSPQPNFPRWDASLSDALYMGSALSHLINAQVPWAEGGALVAGGARGWLGAQPNFLISASGRALQLIRPMLNDRGSLVQSRLRGTPLQRSSDRSGTYESLVSSVTRDADGLNVLLVNRDPDDLVSVVVDNPYFRGRTRARTWLLTGGSIASANRPRRPDAVGDQHQCPTPAVGHTLPATSSGALGVAPTHPRCTLTWSCRHSAHRP
jgi:hypothetical protein